MIDRKRKIQLHDFVAGKNEIWFAINTCNKLYGYNFEKKELYPIDRFPNEKLNKDNLFSAVENYKNKLFFIPFTSDRIHIYDIERDRFESIFLNEDKNILCKYCSCVKNNNFLYLLPICCKNILAINMDDYTQEYIWNVEEFVNLRYENKINIFFNNNSCIFRDGFINYISETKILIMFDIIKKKIQVKNLSSRFNNIISICNYEDKLFCLERNTGNLICLEIKSDKITYMKIDYMNIKKEGFNQIVNIRDGGCIHSIFYDNNVYVCPDIGNICIKIDIETHIAHTVIEDCNIDNSDSKYLNSKMHIVNGKLMFFYGLESSIVSIEGSVLKKEEILLHEEELVALKKEITKELVLEEDSRICNLDFFIENICKSEKENNLDGTGFKIFEEIKGVN